MTPTTLIEGEHGEGIIKEVYAKALENNLSESVRTLIQKQYEAVITDYEIICSLQNKFSNNIK